MHYTYDGNGHIVKTTVNSDKPIIDIYTLGGQKILEIDPNKNKQTDYIYLAGNLVAKSTHSIGQAGSTTTASYYVGDIMGSPAIEMAQDGSISWQQVYLPFGREQNPSTQNPASHPSYIGKPFSAYTGLSYLNARFYNPAIGRFYSVDPQGIDPHSPKSINRYEYANNNPYTYIDPTGFSEQDNSNTSSSDGVSGSSMGSDHQGQRASQQTQSMADDGKPKHGRHLDEGDVSLSVPSAYVVGGVIGAAARGFLSGGIFGMLGKYKDSSYSTLKTGSKSYYRSMSRAEVKAVKETGMLRGGKFGKTYFTDSRYKTANKAQRRLSLQSRPEVQMEFHVTNNPRMSLNGTKVEPDFDQPGLGKEFRTTDPVHVEIKNVQPY
jgi:RHS repeat-associated protein